MSGETGGEARRESRRGPVFPYVHLHDKVMASSGTDIELESVAESQRLRAGRFAQSGIPALLGTMEELVEAVHIELWRVR